MEMSEAGKLSPTSINDYARCINAFLKWLVDGLPGSTRRARDRSQGQIVPRLAGRAGREELEEESGVNRNDLRGLILSDSVRAAEGHRVTEPLAPFHPPEWTSFRRHRQKKRLLLFIKRSHARSKPSSK